ncbi:MULTISPECIES: competence type IV pilus major pilin ComGC [Coprobacillaceae]|mgnify:CR=1 FL=1|uniref:competence type IV pilus major pilin ComGC n=1 Tax=Coprobacillaceae TaxID=2810280 RepID=UPI000E52FE66|nr:MULTISPECIES: prepilin-type N-terminal cleavage/methylation domain-containing protein [Coprobacillaceae]RHM63629.1 prepilin-type N-terminal cleavage/methylation domain-containing protein [Coprobacillus sp. AF33-1AC]RHS96358.1 prepilin-type N-terminal cleavage/methylation domain-containing protein [Erysipelatoclostridium sp. AM42-17]
MKHVRHQQGFTLIEMIFCISVILVILLLVIPEVTSKNRLVKEKSCDAQIEVVNSQIILYEIDHGELPTSMSQLTSGAHPYLKEKQAICPSGLAISISDGEAYVSK